MTRRTIKSWFLIHKWTSIVSTLFLLMLCITGLPLIFHDEIEAALGEDAEAALAGEASSAGGLPLDTMLDRALAERQGEVPLFMAFSNDSPLLTVTTGPAPDAPGEAMTLLFFDRATGESLGPAPGGGVMDFLLQLHTDMFLGLPGMLFLGAMGVFFVVAIVSGVVLYAPFMRRLRFGTLRTARSKRVKWLDWHNLLGATTLAWALVVGVTGAINAFADPLVEQWQNSELADMTAAYEGAAPLPPERYGSLDRAMASARAAQPGLNPQFIAFPGGDWSSRHHYAVFFQGGTPLTRHLLTPALIDAETGELTDMRAMPWYNQALMLSKPLHFGDYGAIPLKILWALLDLATIVVLVSGLYLWLGKRGRSTDERVAEIAAGAVGQPA
ncbi:PepSY domain-containing protein [uncultured Parasphingopyxis sp.]|uniref:PepSY-associated TM helix domain-containing protein n=1 Tax=uncultured Parasphingopyxis sp. TaxID=1547918 RepID=UPI00261F6729|nr:PepSY-associated TM helix domain-containing protein [uncultured Parasphingopyxis sp.]